MLSRDGHPIVIHDDTLNRTTDGRGAVADTDLAELKKLDAGGWYGPKFAGEHIPTLIEVVAELEALGLGANVEIKPSPGRAPETGRVVAEHLAANWPSSLPRPILSSFERDALAAATRVAPQFPRAWIVESVPADWKSGLETLDCGALHCLHRRLRKTKAEAVLEAGYGLRCFTVNDPARARILFDWGVQAVFTDYPDRLLGI